MLNSYLWLGLESVPQQLSLTGAGVCSSAVFHSLNSVQTQGFFPRDMIAIHWTQYKRKASLQEIRLPFTGLSTNAMFLSNRYGPSCSKLTTWLVNESLIFTSSDTQICWFFVVERMWVAFAVTFLAKNIRILYIESAKTVNEMTLNELVKLTTLWTTGPWLPFTGSTSSSQSSSNAIYILSSGYH